MKPKSQNPAEPALGSSGKMTSAASVQNFWLVSQEIAMNDNSKPSGLSRERLEAESVLSQIEYIRPRQGLSASLIVICALCLMTVAAFTVLGLEF
jgi:hypothetical protein